MHLFHAAAPVGETEAYDPESDKGSPLKCPHIYGPIVPSAVIDVLNIIRGEDGSFLSVEGISKHRS